MQAEAHVPRTPPFTSSPRRTTAPGRWRSCLGSPRTRCDAGPEAAVVAHVIDPGAWKYEKGGCGSAGGPDAATASALGKPPHATTSKHTHGLCSRNAAANLF
jgi:hypothetical protein